MAAILVNTLINAADDLVSSFLNLLLIRLLVWPVHRRARTTDTTRVLVQWHFMILFIILNGGFIALAQAQFAVTSLCGEICCVSARPTALTQGRMCRGNETSLQRLVPHSSFCGTSSSVGLLRVFDPALFPSMAASLVDDASCHLAA